MAFLRLYTYIDRVKNYIDFSYLQFIVENNFRVFRE